MSVPPTIALSVIVISVPLTLALSVIVMSVPPTLALLQELKQIITNDLEQMI